MINHSNVAIARAEDVLAEARNCVECIRLAAETLDEKTDPIQYVAGIASKKIDEAVTMLDEAKRRATSEPRFDAVLIEQVDNINLEALERQFSRLVKVRWTVAKPDKPARGKRSQILPS